MFTMAVSALYFAIYSSFDIAILGPQWIVYAGGLIYLFSSICISAYLAVTVVDQTVGISTLLTSGSAFTYRNGSWLGNGLGLW